MFMRVSIIFRIYLLLMILLMTGCAGVKVSFVDSSDYVALRRGDVLTTGRLSVYTGASLQVVGIDKKTCDDHGAACRKALMETTGLHSEKRLSALSELWLQEALGLDKHRRDREHVEAILNAYLETAKHAYTYMFWTERTPNMRALEDRQAQVRDYYNFAVQQMLAVIYEYYGSNYPMNVDVMKDIPLQSGNWKITIRIQDVRFASKRTSPENLIPASSLSFRGLRNQYRRDGLGAEFVAVTSSRVVDTQSAEVPYSETPFPAITAVVTFPGSTLDEVLNVHQADITAYDPYNRENIDLVDAKIPLAANFTSAYGLWLARSGFASQSLLTLIGRGEVLEMPRVYLLQPYNPNRRIVIMLHGLASSPEAWINLANEVMGDETLRRNYQIWQVYYPTNAPIAFNNVEIRKAIQKTLDHFDPESTSRASNNIILIGHSMGGILSRLMVSSSEDRLWEAFLKKYPLQGNRLETARKELGPYMMFDALPQVNRVIFIATPHKGTPLAEIAPVRWIAGIVTVPLSVLGRFTEVAKLLVDPGSANPVSLTRPFNSIDNLSSHDPFIGAVADIPVSSRVRYHSIIGCNTPDLPLSDSSDGIVPYTSAHLDGADSEQVIQSGHSVQETPEAIIEIRRIMHLHLNSSDKKPIRMKTALQ
jgi:pimeloyl-ACP methyl ester carboxylesterase